MSEHQSIFNQLKKQREDKESIERLKLERRQALITQISQVADEFQDTISAVIEELRKALYPNNFVEGPMDYLFRWSEFSAHIISETIPLVIRDPKKKVEARNKFQ